MCDSFVALGSATKDGSVIFAKNSDRPAGEGQDTRIYGAEGHAPGATLHCTYIKIPQAAKTNGVLLSQISWMWGAEMGANEHGVVIGNEAVWTNISPGPPALLGMDLVRLGLERGASAREALDVITSLLETHGQGGACAQNDPGFTYDNSFLIVDASEAWVLETAGQLWAAKRFTTGVHNISNRLSIRSDYELCSKDLSALEGRVDFAARFSTAPVEVEPNSRESWGRQLLAPYIGAITAQTMESVLRHHESGICMHGGFETTASMISVLPANGGATHFMADAPNPCKASFRQVDGFSPTREPLHANL